jgi:hypothetical protein
MNDKWVKILCREARKNIPIEPVKTESLDDLAAWFYDHAMFRAIENDKRMRQMG